MVTIERLKNLEACYFIMENLNRIKDAIVESKTVDELVRNFEKEDIHIRDPPEAIALAQEYWWKINEEERGPLEEYKVSNLDDLPYTSVKRDGIEHRIHGIVHDTHEQKVLSGKVWNFIRDKIHDYDKPEKDEMCLCEPGLVSVFNLRDVKEIPPYKIFPHLLKKAWRLFVVNRKRFQIPKDEEVYVTEMLSTHSERILEGIRKVFRDVGYLPYLRDISERQWLPCPLQIDITNKFSCSPDSGIYSKYIKRFAKNNKPYILHFVAGLGHEKEIAYYL